jgi:tetratricopeptide (TPR) repeat protein
MSRKLLRFLPVTLLFATTCFAQTVAFEGDVKGEDGKPVQKAVVKIDRKDIKGSYKVNTDKKGHYFYGGLPNGTYKITLEVDGKERDSMDNVKSKFGDPTNVSFDLAQAAARAGAAGGAAPAKEEERGMSPAKKAEFEKKKAEQEQALKKNKELNDAFNAGVEAQNAKQWDVAVQSFEKASTLGPDQNVVWGRLADSYTSLASSKTGAEADEALTKAVTSYQKAIELKPDAPEYHNNYALALAKQKKFPEAQAELTKAAQLDPTQAGKYYYNMGAVLVNTGQTEPAGEAFKKAIEADPNYADAYLQYGITLMGKATVGTDGKMVPVAGTVEAFQKYLELAPNGKDVETAKAMLDSVGAKVDTNFSKPGEKKATPKKKSQ